MKRTKKYTVTVGERVFADRCSLMAAERYFDAAHARHWFSGRYVRPEGGQVLMWEEGRAEPVLTGF